MSSQTSLVNTHDENKKRGFLEKLFLFLVLRTRLFCDEARGGGDERAKNECSHIRVFFAVTPEF